MKTTMYIAAVAIGFILIAWLALTIYAQAEGKAKTVWLGEEDSDRRVLITYDPDPIYNLDEQVGLSIAETFSQKDWAVALKTVRATRDDKLSDYDLFVVIANTYNWAPDRSIKHFIQRCSELQDRPIAAMTLGSGSTTRAQRLLEQAILESGNKLIGSQKLWLLRPNDEERIKESNVEVARDMAGEWAKEVSLKYDEEFSFAY